LVPLRAYAFSFSPSFLTFYTLLVIAPSPPQFVIFVVASSVLKLSNVKKLVAKANLLKSFYWVCMTIVVKDCRPPPLPPSNIISFTFGLILHTLHRGVFWHQNIVWGFFASAFLLFFFTFVAFNFTL
jgi:hypothetical protein